MAILRGKRLGFSIAEIREVLEMYKSPPSEENQLRKLIKKIGDRRESLVQKRKDIDETIAELDQVEEQNLGRLAELGVTT